MRVSMGVVARVALLAGLVLAAVAMAILLWPLHANGVSGRALWPHYSAFGFWTFSGLPAHPTDADLRHAGIQLPQDVVAHRRQLAEVFGASALVVWVGAYLARRRARRTDVS